MFKVCATLFIVGIFASAFLANSDNSQFRKYYMYPVSIGGFALLMSIVWSMP